MNVEGRCTEESRTEISPVIFRGSRVGMLWKISSQVLETRCGVLEEYQPRHIMKRNRIGLYRESEGFKVPFEDKGLYLRDHFYLVTITNIKYDIYPWHI